jgi:hypothetical protein
LESRLANALAALEVQTVTAVAAAVVTTAVTQEMPRMAAPAGSQWHWDSVSGYSLIYCDSHGVNCFFVRNDVLGWSPRPSREQLLPVETVYRLPNYFAKGWTYAPDQQRREWVCV